LLHTFSGSVNINRGAKTVEYLPAAIWNPSGGRTAGSDPDETVFLGSEEECVFVPPQPAISKAPPVATAIIDHSRIPRPGGGVTKRSKVIPRDTEFARGTLTSSTVSDEHLLDARRSA
jgi:hypothetical protein